MTSALVLDDLVVDHGTFVLGPVDLTVGPGICAVLGPNGSGKSTLIGALMGLVPTAAGAVSWDGADLRARSSTTLRDVAYVSDSADDVFSQLTAVEHWRLVAAVRARTYGEDPDALVHQALDLAHLLDLDAVEERIEAYSLGMRRKTQLVGALMGRPRLLVVDEPQNGLDFSASESLRGLLRQVADEGGTVLMSNHDLDSVARVADRVIVLRGGAVVGDLCIADHRRGGHDLEVYVRDRLVA